MSNGTDAKKWALQEPWRMGQGQAFRKLDQFTEGLKLVKCDFSELDVIFDNNGWWCCRKCGYCGSMANLDHFKPEHPQDLYDRSLEFFLNMRKEQGLSHDEAMNQAHHITGMALRAAATVRPDEITSYIENHIRLDSESD